MELNELHYHKIKGKDVIFSSNNVGNDYDGFYEYDDHNKRKIIANKTNGLQKFIEIMKQLFHIDNEVINISKNKNVINN